METTVNTSNFEQFYRTLFPRLVQFAMAYTENEADALAYRTASHDQTVDIAAGERRCA